ncbi:lysine N(6)-hydroxylase/L-ornithine N(5)-oxygenase family protein [Streptomyces desertarenae]|uniref:L-lysine N6-monooxygenase MbtG n=1 Tax=Streptomyces desertarenae TaxID=2666184 RepID=A0ABW4PIX2_9ACTN
MSESQLRAEIDPVYDVVGVGFGPSNLALAIAMEEHNEAVRGERTITGVFLERKQSFGWHRGMLIEGATMQVSFLKDLVTLRRPVSRFGFVPYLHERGRLVDFINQKTFFPTREEFHDYLEWAAGGVSHMVRYDSEVTAVRPVVTDGEVRLFEVVSRRPGEREETVHRARNVVVACGLRPFLPEGVTASGRVWHSSDLLPNLKEIKEDAAPTRFVVVGAGQSAAEAVWHLHRTYPSAEVCAVFSRYGYGPADDSPYANRVFDPEAVDVYFHADGQVKAQLMGYHRNTNYSVVDMDLIEELYRTEYQEKVRGQRRLRILRTSRVTDVHDGPDRAVVRVQDLTTATAKELHADAVVFATGYRPFNPAALLGEADRLCVRDAAGRLCVERDYRVRTDPAVRAGVYLQGGTEHTHGITSSLLSMVAVRAGEILDSILLSTRAEPGAVERPAVLSGSHE